MGNIITIAGENSKENGKSKKGGGFNAVLTLLKDLSDFQDKVQGCIDSQDLADNKKKLEIFDSKLDEMAQVLLEMAEAGVRSKKKLDGSSEEVESDSELNSKLDSFVEDKSPIVDPSSVGKIQMVNIPSIPRFR